MKKRPNPLPGVRERLLEALKAAGVEQGSRNRTVAVKMGYSGKTVANILSGNAPLSDRFLFHICNHFGINADWLYDASLPMLNPAYLPFATHKVDILGAILDDGMEEFVEKHSDNPKLINDFAETIRLYVERVLGGDFDLIQYVMRGLEDRKCFEIIKDFTSMSEPDRWKAVGVLKDLAGKEE